MSTPRWQTIFFDLDGTLANTIPLIVASYQHAFRTVLGEEVDDARARAWIGRPLLPALLEESPERGHDLDATYREWNLANTERLIERYAGVPEMLTALTEAGANLHVVTSKRTDTARLALVGVGIDGLIDVAGALEDTDRHKPDPDPLLVAAGKVGADPADAVYVGDATVDVLAAKAAGMHAVAVTWGAGTREALEATGPDAVVDSVEQLTAYLLGGTDVTTEAREHDTVSRVQPTRRVE
ncbi:pyrophosphatase PpaX [Knoellia remsis]|uniref:Tyrosine-protein kinase PtkA n=1 Tax=Knoellia remsis TaxID=407159 RepID=A0A2T0UJ96_9MICO|nr:HAD-IA family hydrolase [Knoellia remsis]PRY57982.1 pyrophosphatase PpaX [Knoellia remsis]